MMIASSLSRKCAAAGMATVMAFTGLASLAPSTLAQADDQEYEANGGTVITWTNDWIGGDVATLEDEDNGEYEYLGLADQSEDGCNASCAVYISIWDAAETDPASLSDAYFDREAEDDAEIVFQDDDASSAMAVSITEEPEGANFYYVFEGENDDVIEVYVGSQSGEVTASLVESLDEGIEIDGDSPYANLELDQVYEALGGNATESDGEDEETPEADDDNGDVDAEEYLAAVQDQYDAWSADYDRFLEIMDEGDLEDDEIADEFNTILNGFLEAPDVAAELDAPAEYAEIQDAYEAYADGLAEITNTLDDFLATEEDSPEEDDAWDAFLVAVDEAADLGTDLEDALADA